MTTEALAPPPDYADSGEVVMTNFDGSIDRPEPPTGEPPCEPSSST